MVDVDRIDFGLDEVARLVDRQHDHARMQVGQRRVLEVLAADAHAPPDAEPTDGRHASGEVRARSGSVRRVPSRRAIRRDGSAPDPDRGRLNIVMVTAVARSAGEVGELGMQLQVGHEVLGPGGGVQLEVQSVDLFGRHRMCTVGSKGTIGKPFAAGTRTPNTRRRPPSRTPGAPTPRRRR